MTFEKFIVAAQNQDPRNAFSVSTYECKGLPEDVARFYKESNPVDVEIVYDGVNIAFVPVEKILMISNEYGFSHDSVMISL